MFFYLDNEIRRTDNVDIEAQVDWLAAHAGSDAFDDLGDPEVVDVVGGDDLEP